MVLVEKERGGLDFMALVLAKKETKGAESLYRMNLVLNPKIRYTIQSM